jgi:hypothetical protein
LAFDTAYDTLLATVARRDRLDAAIAELAAASAFTPVVTRLGCLRGVSTLTAFGLAVEIGDWRRLTGRSMGAYLGLVPTESSSGGSRSQGPITKTGNGHARRLLIEAAWHHRPAYWVGWSCGVGWRGPPRPRGIAGSASTGGYTPVGSASAPATSARSSRIRRSPASSPTGAGRWPSSRTDGRAAR